MCLGNHELTVSARTVRFNLSDSSVHPVARGAHLASTPVLGPTQSPRSFSRGGGGKAAGAWR